MVEQAASPAECPWITRGWSRPSTLGRAAGPSRITVRRTCSIKVIGETTGIEMNDEASLMNTMTELAAIRKRYDKIKNAMDEVEATGYGIVMPVPGGDDLGGSPRSSNRAAATASACGRRRLRSICSRQTSNRGVPIVGSEKQSEELVNYLLREFEESPSKIWESNIFGTSLYGLVNEGLHNKLYRMPSVPASSSRRRSSGSSTRDAAASSASSCKENSA